MLYIDNCSNTPLFFTPCQSWAKRLPFNQIAKSNSTILSVFSSPSLTREALFPLEVASYYFILRRFNFLRVFTKSEKLKRRSSFLHLDLNRGPPASKADAIIIIKYLFLLSRVTFMNEKNSREGPDNISRTTVLARASALYCLFYRFPGNNAICIGKV